MYARSCETDVTGTAQSTGQAGNSGPGQGDGDSPVDGGGTAEERACGTKGGGQGGICRDTLRKCGRHDGARATRALPQRQGLVGGGKDGPTKAIALATRDERRHAGDEAQIQEREPHLVCRG